MLVSLRLLNALEVRIKLKPKAYCTVLDILISLTTLALDVELGGVLNFPGSDPLVQGTIPSFQSCPWKFGLQAQSSPKDSAKDNAHVRPASHCTHLIRR